MARGLHCHRTARLSAGVILNKMAQSLIHEILPVGLLQCNCHVLGDPETHEALVVDPGDQVEDILQIVLRHGLTVKALVSTHAHIDHVGGLKAMRDSTGAPVLMHPEDLELFKHLDVQAAWIGMRPPDPVNVDSLLKDGDSLQWGRFRAHVLHTPGHSPGSICLHIPSGQSATMSLSDFEGEIETDRVLAGDTLFAGTIGRTDLWGGSPEMILRSIQSRLLVLPENARIYPGHGPPTTLGREKETNPFLRGL